MLPRFWLSKIKTILFPPTCAFCGTPTEEYYSLCSHCWLSLNFINRNTCRCCGAPIQAKQAERYPSDISTQCCEACLRSGFSPPCHQFIAALVYDDFSKPFILRMKEHNEPHLALVFAKFFNKNDINNVDFIVPVPLHPLRLWQRTYNQAALLALGLRHWNKDCPPVRLDLLKRTQCTPKQKGRNKEERTRNVNGVFTVPSAAQSIIKEKTIALIDDVIGSGATMSECRRVLLASGAAEVRALALAKAFKTR